MCSWTSCRLLASGAQLLGLRRLASWTSGAGHFAQCWSSTCSECGLSCLRRYGGGRWKSTFFGASRKLNRLLCRCHELQKLLGSRRGRKASAPKSQPSHQQALCSSLCTLSHPLTKRLHCEQIFRMKLTRMSCWVGIYLPALTANKVLFIVIFA